MDNMADRNRLLFHFPSGLEGDAELSHAEMAVVARYPSFRDVPRVGRLIPRRHASHYATVTDLEPDLLYLSHGCITLGFILWIAQNNGVHVTIVRDCLRHLLADPSCGASANFNLHERALSDDEDGTRANLTHPRDTWVKNHPVCHKPCTDWP
jgi:hypothetical protein